MVESGPPSRSPRVPGSRYARSIVLAALACAALLTLPAGASALKLHPCAGDSSFGCGALRVPLDHGGATPGRLSIAVAAQSSVPQERQGDDRAVGGPGQGSVDAAGSFALSLEPVLEGLPAGHARPARNRALGCAGSARQLQRLGGLEELQPAAVAACAKRIGSRRAFYRTADTVEDLEALRKALGVRKIGLMGISYGTWVAQEYARRYPTHTDSLILDSIVGPDPPDAFAMGNFETLPRILREECARHRCKDATGDIVGDIGKVAAKLHSAPLRGHVFDARGRAHPASYTTESQFYFLVTSGDLNPFLQARLPGAVASAAQGDLGPLLRLKRIGEGPATKTSELSFGLNVTTGCLDAQLPFPLSTEPGTRAPLVQSALAAIPPGSYTPWSADVVRDTSYADDCLLWPRDDRPKPSASGLPDVRSLLLVGRLDMRTPLEDALKVKAQLPRSQIVVVPGNGHDQVDTDGTGCVARALTLYTAGKRIGRPCAGKSNQVMPLPRAPLKLSEFRTPARIPGPRGRTLLAVLDTVEDARFSGLEAVYGGFAPRGGGLRGGSFDSTDAFSGTDEAARLQLRPRRPRERDADGRRLEGPRPRDRDRARLRIARRALHHGGLGHARRPPCRVLARGRRAHGRRRRGRRRLPCDPVRATEAFSGPAPVEAVKLEQRFRVPDHGFRAGGPRPGRQGRADKETAEKRRDAGPRAARRAAGAAGTRTAGARC